MFAVLDSLKSVEIVGILKAGLGTTVTTWLSPRPIYENPTIRKLSQIIFDEFNQKQSSRVEHGTPAQRRVMQMASLVTQYTEGLPAVSTQKNQSLNPSGLNVVLTGSTGSLGAHLRCKMLNDPETSKIFCLNRSANAKSQQKQSSATFGLEYSLDASRVEFIQANFGHK